MIRLFYDNFQSRADIERDTGKNITTDEGLETAVLISLFTERKADPSDDPQQGTDLRGWWADDFPEVTGDLIGSRIWLLQRAKTTQDTLNQLQLYGEESLQWMLDDGVASAVTVTAERIKPQLAAIRVVIERPDPGTSTFDAVWEARINAL